MTTTVALERMSEEPAHNATKRLCAFDKIAVQYDAIWSDTAIGKAQRAAVWSRIDPLFDRNSCVLDLGCGTGVDAQHLQARGVSVYGIDRSPRMIEIARARGLKADCCPIEDIQYLDLRLDGVISNFGALNCLPSLAVVAASLGRMVRRDGYLALCFIARTCLWEIGFYLAKLKPAKAFRRLKGHSSSSLGKIFYPTAAEIVSVFKQHFRLIASCGIGLTVPPSYVNFPTVSQIELLAALDQRLAAKPLVRALADHRLYIFKRV